MKVSFSVGARERAFAKMMRRIRPDFQALIEKLNLAQLDGPAPPAILIGIMDELPYGTYEVVPNSDGFFQVTAGCDLMETEKQLKTLVFNIIRTSVARCPLTDADHKKLATIFLESAAEYE